MIIVAIALLLAAAVLLAIGITSSSVPPLVISLLCTLAAAGVLRLAFTTYRDAARGGRGYPGAYGDRVEPVGPTMPVAAGPWMAPPMVAPIPPSVPAGWDAQGPEQAVALVEGLDLEELHAVRRHEVEHLNRKVVVAALDDRIDRVIALRRQLGNAGSSAR